MTRLTRLNSPGPACRGLWARPAAVCATLLLAVSLTLAQTDSGGTAPRLSYHSVLSDYQGFNDQSLIPWRESNALVEKIGGWRVYAREASASPSAATEGAAGQLSSPAGAAPGATPKTPSSPGVKP